MSVKSVACAALVVLTAVPTFADSPSLLKIFARDSESSAAATARELTQEDGPWLILAATFVGDGARSRAERLAEEIRKEMKLPAFLYEETFDFTGELTPGAGSRRVRYANQYAYEAVAVLVGEYDTVEHPNIDKDLAKIKSMRPAVYQDVNVVVSETNLSTPVTAIKAIHQKLLSRKKDQGKGELAGAFVTRNPMLPPEYFESPQVDSFVHHLNEDKAHNLLQCKGKYTVIVRTFEGMGTIVGSKQTNEFEPNQERLDRYAEQAGKMVEELRKRGEEAYQFHDRTRSLVTVGSFDTLGRELPGGGFEYSPEIVRVMEKYRAFNVDPEIARQLKPGTRGAIAQGAAKIPFDIEPTPIAVPKVSKRSLYTAALRIP